MIIKRENKAGLIWFEGEQLRIEGVVHGFSSRVGGVSGDVFKGLNMGNPGRALYAGELDDVENIATNLRLFCEAVGGEGMGFAKPWQVHSGLVKVVRKADVELVNDWQIDGIVTGDRGVLLGVSNADCVPVLLRDAKGEVVGAVHAGWRGIVGGVVGNAVELMRCEFGVDAVVGAVGPCMGVGAFEVGVEVAKAFEDEGLGGYVHAGEKAGKFRVDLVGSVVAQLRGVGVDRVDFCGGDELCTFSDADLFYSHRRENGATGRMMSVIGRL